MSRIVGAGLIMAQLALACPSALATPSHAQTSNPVAVAAPDLSGYALKTDVANAQTAAQSFTTSALTSYTPTATLNSAANIAAFGSQMIAAGQVQPAGNYALVSQVPSIAGLLSASTAAATYVTPAQAAAAAPVQKVNGLTGSVTVPGSVRATCLVSTFDGTGTGSCSYGTFTGGTSFTATPDCFAELTTTATGYIYAFPVITRGLTSSSVVLSAAQKVLNISLGATTIWVAPPSGTSLTLICRGQ